MAGALPIDYASALFTSKKGVLSERVVLGDGRNPIERAAIMPQTHVRTVLSGIARVHAFFALILRLTARALYLFPILIIAKIVLWLLREPAGDYITVGFVLLVCFFFANFAVTILLHAIMGPRSSRRTTARLVFEPPALEDVEKVAAAMRPDVRVTGRVDAGLAEGEPVLVEEWSSSDDGLSRYVEGRSFVVIPDTGAPCVVELVASPLLIARYDEESISALTIAGTLGSSDAPGPRSRCIIRQGQRVAIAGHDPIPAVRIEDARLRALLPANALPDPYRGAEATGILIRSTPERPVIILVTA